MPNLVIIAGSNGAGKTTSAPMLLKNTLQVDDFVNADTIAQGLCGFCPEQVSIQAGRIMLKYLRELAERRANFAFETTLASRTFATWIPLLKKQGYKVSLVYLWLNSVELAISRVKERVESGGHNIPEKTIRRRYKAGLKNFFSLYRPIVDFWQFYDNSLLGNPGFIAGVDKSRILLVESKNVWMQLIEKYGERTTNKA